MPPVIRIGDIGMGHGCFSDTQTIEGSFDVLANGLGVHRIGDALEFHSCGPLVHNRSTCMGSFTVFANSIGVARTGDGIFAGTASKDGSTSPNCGVLGMGSPNVMAG